MILFLLIIKKEFWQTLTGRYNYLYLPPFFECIKIRNLDADRSVFYLINGFIDPNQKLGAGLVQFSANSPDQSPH